MTAIDGPEQQCLPQGAVGTFYRRQPNPKHVAGSHTFTDSKLDTQLLDPDLHWNETGAQWHLYYASPHGTYDAPGSPVIRRATSANLASWTLDDAPSLSVAASGWDSTHVAAPTVVYNPAAPADRRYLMLYAGASQTFPNYTFPDFAIGAAFSADGKTFTRITSAQSPHGEAGLVLTGAQAHPGAPDATVSDPEVVLVDGTYHLWFTSFACSGASCATVDARGISHATSTDGITWMLDAAPVPSLLRTSSNPATGGGQPSVVYDAVHCRWEMWLTNEASAAENDNQPTNLDNATGIWHAHSTNATSWTINYAFARDVLWDGAASGEHLGMRTGADVALKSTGRYMVYTGYDDANVPGGSTLPTTSGSTPGVMTLNLATRDAPP